MGQPRTVTQRFSKGVTNSLPCRLAWRDRTGLTAGVVQAAAERPAVRLRYKCRGVPSRVPSRLPREGRWSSPAGCSSSPGTPEEGVFRRRSDHGRGRRHSFVPAARWRTRVGSPPQVVLPPGHPPHEHRSARVSLLACSRRRRQLPQARAQGRSVGSTLQCRAARPKQRPPTEDTGSLGPPRRPCSARLTNSHAPTESRASHGRAGSSRRGADTGHDVRVSLSLPIGIALSLLSAASPTGARLAADANQRPGPVRGPSRAARALPTSLLEQEARQPRVV